MANLIDIRRRIRSVKSTQQITRAMKMVAAARLRRAQDRILATRPYALELKRVVGDVVSSSEDLRHPLLEERRERKVLLLVVTGDKGLCGSFNASVVRRTEYMLRDQRWPEVELMLLGKKGHDIFRRRELEIRGAYTKLFTNVQYGDAREIASTIATGFRRGEYDAVYAIYNHFASLLTQVLTEERILPVETAASDPNGDQQFEFEPSAAVVLADLLPRYLEFQIYRILLESQAAEHAARMTAMDSATKNASEMIDRLTLTYNRARQAAITTELIEVVSGANALEG